jgi:hypothetical protein
LTDSDRLQNPTNWIHTSCIARAISREVLKLELATHPSRKTGCEGVSAYVRQDSSLEHLLTLQRDSLSQ